ncbi:MAG: CARDB domain-containing protein [Actinomycetota bacterium]
MKLRKIHTSALAVLVLSAFLSAVPPGAQAVPNPVATTDAEHLAYGRVFPDPQGCLAFGVPDSDGDGVKDTPDGVSPYAKGQVCAEQFLGYDEVIAGSEFLEQKYPRFLQVIRLDEAYDNGNYKSAGIPNLFGLDEDGNPQVLSRERRPLYLFKVTDAQSPIPEADRLHFAYSLSIHGIERAGLEGGIRAMEDLITWAACEYDPTAAPACAVEGPFPKEIVETPTSHEVPTAGDVLSRSVIYFVPPNPDGWRRGEAGEGGVYYQRYNGNGVDLNRDWPTIGYSYRPYSPGSEPETKAYSEVLTGIRKNTSGNRFAGGIDLHGQLLAVAFSFTLIGAGERDFRKNFSTVDQSLRAWEDQTNRLSWSPYIADANRNGVNDPGEECPNHNILVTSGNFPYCFADQWGTVVDTIGYQITGGFGDWFDSPLGLNAVGIDNEMSMSHITPNNVYDPINEQMHVDGNKGLIYSQIASMVTEQDSDFVYEPPGKIGYVFNPERLEVEASDRPQNPGLPAQNDIDTLVPCVNEVDCGGGRFVMQGTAPTLEFDVRGPDRGVFNGGITVEATFLNADGISTGSLPRISLQTFIEQQWQTVATHFGQGGSPDLYLQAGQTVSANDPVPGRWRVHVSSGAGGPVRLEIDFNPVEAEASPGQTAISASSMDFFDDLNEFVSAGGEKLTPVTVDEILANPGVLDGFDSLVVVDDFMPGFVPEPEPPFTGPPQDAFSFQVLGGDPLSGGDAVHEFDVLGQADGFDNDRIVATSSWEIPSDWDVYVEEFFNGKWVDRGCECTFVANGEEITVTTPEPGRWRIRIDNFAAAPQPVDVHVEFFSDPPLEPDPSGDGGESQWSAAQFDQYTGALAAFANDGGNLVLTDGALRGLKALGIATGSAEIRSNQPGGRGAVPRFDLEVFGRGNLCTPDTTDTLARDICLPGTAGGTARQVVEAAPLGYSPDATLDGVAEAKINQFFVTRDAWEDGCGKANPAECTSALLGAGVGLGERRLGDGVIRIAGALLPDPNFRPSGPRDMRFGLASYALTFAGWQAFLNLVNYQRPPRLPDLTVSDLTASAKPREGRTVTLTATIDNPGTAAAGASTTEFLLDGETVLGNVATPSIAVGGSVQVSLDWNTVGVRGEHTIRATADRLTDVAELNEENNAGELTVTIQGNKVTNGSFEQASADGSGPAAWSASDTGAGDASWSSEGGTDGSSGAAITGTGGSVALAGAPTWTSAPIDVTPGDTLDLVVSVDTNGVSSAPAIGLAYLGAAGQLLDTVKVLTAPLSTDGFTTLEKSVTIPTGVAEVRVVLIGFSATDTNTSGRVIFDDVGLYSG